MKNIDTGHEIGQKNLFNLYQNLKSSDKFLESLMELLFKKSKVNRLVFIDTLNSAKGSIIEYHLDDTGVRKIMLERSLYAEESCTLKNRSAYISNDFKNDPMIEYANQLDSINENQSVTSKNLNKLLIYPVYVAGSCLGLIKALNEEKEDNFSEKDLRNIESFICRD